MKDVIDLSLPVDIYNLQGNLISDSGQISFYAYIYRPPREQHEESSNSLNYPIDFANSTQFSSKKDNEALE